MMTKYIIFKEVYYFIFNLHIFLSISISYYFYSKNQTILNIYFNIDIIFNYVVITFISEYRLCSIFNTKKYY